MTGPFQRKRSFVEHYVPELGEWMANGKVRDLRNGSLSELVHIFRYVTSILELHKAKLLVIFLLVVFLLVVFLLVIFDLWYLTCDIFKSQWTSVNLQNLLTGKLQKGTAKTPFFWSNFCLTVFLGPFDRICARHLRNHTRSSSMFLKEYSKIRFLQKCIFSKKYIFIFYHVRHPST